ncbi:hypothetical protein Acr_00g0009940 [Actinidia rufa]|uniref:Uncharacterized protein n=1 Tax=Actinidia rufa TaxID=165716 RepID=A0A7J0D904_9ERIC|nr:hypothetical protein Acr_00g0009940 [Actinidia rufa]
MKGREMTVICCRGSEERLEREVERGRQVVLLLFFGRWWRDDGGGSGCGSSDNGNSGGVRMMVEGGDGDMMYGGSIGSGDSSSSGCVRMEVDGGGIGSGWMVVVVWCDGGCRGWWWQL